MKGASWRVCYAFCACRVVCKPTAAATHVARASMGGGVSKKSPAAGGGGAAPPKTTKSKAKNELDFKVGELVNIGTLVAESGGMLAALDPTFNAVGEAAEGNYGVVVGGSGLAIVDMSDPKNLKKIRGIDTGVLSKAGSGTAALSHDGKYLYVAGGLGIAIVDMRLGPERAKRISTCDTGVLCHKSGGHVLCGEVGTFSQNLIFVTGGLGVAIVDVSDPAEPKFLSSVSTGVLTTSSQCSSALLTCAKGTFLYVAGEPGLAVIDVNDPKAPKAVGLGKEGEGSPVKTGVGATYWDDNKCRGNHVLLNIDPSLPSQAKPGAASREKEADRMIAYVVGGKGLAVFDLKHPCAPELLTTITDTSVLITQSGGHAALCSTRLLVSGARGLCVLDASKPRTPAIVGKVKVGVATNAGSLSVASSDGIYAFCVGGKGVATIDLSKLDALRQKFEDESAFWFVSADKIRSSSEKTLPAMQELQGREGWLSRQDVPFSTACAGNYANGKFLAVSHRWEDSKKPDQQGVQLAEVKKYLAANPAVEWVWCAQPAACSPALYTPRADPAL